MKKQDINNEALIYTSQADADDYANVDEVRHAFIAGAEWRINSVWHDVEESPKQEGCEMLYEDQEYEDYRNDMEDRVSTLEGAFCRILDLLGD